MGAVLETAACRAIAGAAWAIVIGVYIGLFLGSALFVIAVLIAYPLWTFAIALALTVWALHVEGTAV